MSRQKTIGVKRKTTMSTRNIVFISLTAAFAAALLPLFYFWWIWGGGVEIAEQNRMTAYLNHKYGQQFIVGKLQKSTMGLGSDATWNASAHPKSDSNMKFYVGGRFADGYSDQYVPATWAKAETVRIQPDVKRIFAGIPVNVSIRISLRSPLSDEDKVNLTLASPTYEEAKQKYPNSITNFIQLDFDKKPADIAMVAERAYTLMQNIKQEGVKTVYLKYRERGADGESDMGRSCGEAQTVSPGAVEECFRDKVILEKEL